MYIESRLQRVRLIRVSGYCEQINSYWASALSLITMLKSSDTTNSLGCACFPECLQNFSEHQILWSLCSVVFYALTLRLPILTSLSVSPELKVCVRSGKKGENFRKTRMHSSRMHTESSLTVSPYLIVSHAHPPEQPRTPPWSNHACPPKQPDIPPSSHAPPRSNHACPPSNHACPPVDKMWTHASENITFPQLRCGR